MKNSSATYLGVDLGGTKLLVGEMNERGELLRHKKYASGPLPQPAALELIQNSVADYLATGRPAGAPQPLAMGVGLVGRIDSQRGLWLEIEPGRTAQLPIAQLLARQFELPCYADNDVRSAAKAEMLFGYGSQSENLVYINVGTGLAAGIVAHGRLISGGHCNAGEVGHTGSGILQRVPCICGRPDCVEAVAAGSGIDKCARLLAPEYPGTLLRIPPEGERVEVAEVFALYEQDALCRRLADNAAQALANLVMNLVRVTDPDTVVLGGGVMSDGFLYPKVLEKIDPYTTRFVTNGIVLTKLNPAFVGLMGACSNAIQGLKQPPQKQETEETA